MAEPTELAHYTSRDCAMLLLMATRFVVLFEGLLSMRKYSLIDIP